MRQEKVRSPLHLLLSLLFLGASAVSFSPNLAAAQQPEEDAGEEEERPRVFTLGEIVVIGTREGGLATVGASVVTEAQLRTFERRTLEQAVNLAPGVVGGYSGNSRRNEPNIYVRGQDRWRVPLMLDGVRLYLPADNRIDFARFSTSNLASVQIQKGYASVLDGPGAMGGAVNLVTRRPTRPVEAEAGITLGGRSDLEEWGGYATIGGRVDKFYVLTSYSYSDRDSWSLSGKYEPRIVTETGELVRSDESLQGVGERVGSDTRDWNLNLKVGFTPNETDEYAINFLRQEGEKSGLLDVYNSPPPVSNSFWKWPWWDVQSLSFLSTTALGSSTYLKTRIFRLTFDNALYAYDDDTYTVQSLGRGFQSIYDDENYGASIELGTRLGASNDLRTAFHYRDDIHVEYQYDRPDHPTASSVQPRQTQSHVTWSAAVENTWRAASNFDVVAGVSYESYQVERSEEYNSTDGIFERAKGGADTFNWQGAAIWRASANRQLHASVSSRTRFPGLWELYSTRFGTATPNPDLGAERAINMELGVTESLGGGTTLSASVFYNLLSDLIQSVPLMDGSNTVQTQNVGDGRFLGFEISAEARLLPTLLAGGNVSYINREITDDVLERQREADGLPPLHLTEVPPVTAFAFATWTPMTRLNLTPSVEFATDRWSDITVPGDNALAGTQIETGGHTLLNAVAEYAVSERATVSIGARNLLDENFELVWGLPEPGRNLYVKMRRGI